MGPELSREPRARFQTLARTLAIPDELLGSGQGIIKKLIMAEQAGLIVAHECSLYALLRADLVVADIGESSQGEQGIDLLYARVGGIPTLGLTDRSVNAPSVLRLLDCVVVLPTTLENLLDRITSMLPAPEPPHDQDPDTQPEIPTGKFDQRFAEQVLHHAVVKPDVAILQPTADLKDPDPGSELP